MWLKSQGSSSLSLSTFGYKFWVAKLSRVWAGIQGRFGVSFCILVRGVLRFRVRLHGPQLDLHILVCFWGCSGFCHHQEGVPEASKHRLGNAQKQQDSDDDDDNAHADSDRHSLMQQKQW